MNLLLYSKREERRGAFSLLPGNIYPFDFHH